MQASKIIEAERHLKREVPGMGEGTGEAMMGDYSRG
jgi:hypothetical protein